MPPQRCGARPGPHGGRTNDRSDTATTRLLRPTRLYRLLAIEP
ncbi:hypothetical protein [Kitasatospora sp. NPDC087314]